MTKTKEKLQQLKQEYESLTNRLKQLSDDELKYVTGGYKLNTVFKITLSYMFDNSNKLV